MHRTFFIPILALVAPATAQPLTTEQIDEQAAERIEQYRMADATLRVVDANGGAVVGASVRVEQVRHEFLFGCNLFGFSQPNDEDKTRYLTAFTDVFNYATLPFYWGGFEPRRDEPGYARLDEMADWCVETGITPKGHPLVWNMVPPGWLTENDSMEEIKDRSDARVREIIEHFSGRIDIWDVVNEAADPFRFQNPVTEAWRFYGQIPFALEPFRVARNANHEATLLINDYRTDEAYADVIKQLVSAPAGASVDDGAEDVAAETEDESPADAEPEPDPLQPVYDVIGIQSHMHGGAWSSEHTWRVCERFAEFGVPLHFTETTVVSGPREGDAWGATTPELEEQQAEDTARFYTILFSHPAVEAITWWDFADRNAWQGAAAGWLRDDLSAKPVYDRMKDLIRGEWWTSVDGETDEEGAYAFRGFLGDYHIEITLPDGEVVPMDVTVSRDGANELECEAK